MPRSLAQESRVGAQAAPPPELHRGRSGTLSGFQIRSRKRGRLCPRIDQPQAVVTFPGILKAYVLASYVRTAALMSGLIALLAIGGRLVMGDRGMLLFGGFGLLVNAVSYWFSDKLALLAHRAQEVGAPEAPTLHAIVQRLTQRAGLPMPRLYIIPSATANAFATGRNPHHAAVAVTDGILQILSERELEAVLAHELSHVKNRDILIATVAAGIAGVISTVGYVMQWGL